jgi:hypothetical protein
VCNRCQQKLNLHHGGGHGHFVMHHMNHVKMDEQAAM